MFLVRAAFWLSVVIMFLPADPESGEQAPRVTAFQAISAAGGAISDLSQFCTRNPDVCETGGSAFHVFADKLRYGAKMLYGYFGNDETTANPVPAAGTLHPEDVSPAWRAPKPDAA
jgi:hypothetical protein